MPPVFCAVLQCVLHNVFADGLATVNTLSVLLL